MNFSLFSFSFSSFFLFFISCVYTHKHMYMHLCIYTVCVYITLTPWTDGEQLNFISTIRYMFVFYIWAKLPSRIMFIFSFVPTCVSGSYPAADLVNRPHKKLTEILKKMDWQLQKPRPDTQIKAFGSRRHGMTLLLIIIIYCDNARERDPFNWCKLIEYSVAKYWSWMWIKTVGHVLFILCQKSFIFFNLSGGLSVCARKMHVCVALMAAKY